VLSARAQAQAIAYECAREVITDLSAICTARIYDELAKQSPDHGFIAALEEKITRLFNERRELTVANQDEIANMVQPNTEVIYMPDQEKTDLEKGLEFLISKKFAAVNIVWATGKRSDHYINNIATLARYKDQINLVMLDNYSKIYPINSGFKKHFSEHSNVSLIPLNKVENLKTSNLVWNLKNETLEYPYRTSSSNKVLATGIVEISFDSGVLLMMECIDVH
jgi:thiamine pyrophosphokinase